MKDSAAKIVEAIDAVEARDATRVNVVTVQVQIASTGRPLALLVPDDLNDVEIIELAAFILIGLRPRVAELAGPRSRLIVPS